MQQVNAQCHDHYGRTAGGYLAQIDKFSTYIYFGLEVSHLIFAGTEQYPQRKDTAVQEVTTTADLTVSYLERLRTVERFHSFYEDVVKN